MKRYIIIALLLILLLQSVVVAGRGMLNPRPSGSCTIQCPDGTQMPGTFIPMPDDYMLRKMSPFEDCGTRAERSKCPNVMVPTKCGDLDNDGYLTQNDIRLLKIAIINKNLLGFRDLNIFGYARCADFNLDYKIDNVDLLQAEAVLNGQATLKCYKDGGYYSDKEIERMLDDKRFHPSDTEKILKELEDEWAKSNPHPIRPVPATCTTCPRVFTSAKEYAQYMLADWVKKLPTEVELKDFESRLRESSKYLCSGENPIISGVPQQASVAQCSGTIGDLNGDSSVSMNDALILLSEVVMGRLPSTPTGLCCRDADGNGIVDSDDVTTIFSIARGKIHVPTSCGVALPPSQAGPIQPLTPQPLPRSTCSNPIDFSLALTQHPTLYGSNCNTGGGCFIEHEFRSGAICCGAPNLGSILFYKNTRTQKEWAFAPNRDGKAIIKVFLTNTNIGDNFDVYANCP